MKNSHEMFNDLDSDPLVAAAKEVPQKKRRVRNGVTPLGQGKYELPAAQPAPAAPSSDEPWETAEPQAEPQEDFTGRFTTAQTAFKYMTAGNATVTLKSKATGTRFTYRIRQKREEDGQIGPRGLISFVSLMTGSDNESDFQYLGHFWSTQMVYWHGKKSKIGKDAPGAKAFDWVWRQLSNNVLPPQLEVWHEGRCGRCGRKLTVPESIASGFGPECINHVHG
jgi:hypothetical protein